MIILNMRDGSSRKYDLADPAQLASLNALGNSAAAMAGVSGVWLKTDTHATTIPAPRGFATSSLVAELLANESALVGERLTFQVDDVALSVLAYYGAGKTSNVMMQRVARRGPRGG